MPSDIRYDDPCGIARAMGVIGDRWAVLVVRELMFGGRRFAQLRHGLYGISPNVLSQRLRDLEASGVVQRTVLEPPADVTIYELTDRGRGLEPVLIELGRWGSREAVSTQRDLSPSALMFALKTVFDPAAARDGSFAIDLDAEAWTVTVGSDVIDVARGSSGDADVTFDTDLATLRSVAFGRESVLDAERAGRLTLSGDRRLAARFGRLFPVGAPVRP